MGLMLNEELIRGPELDIEMSIVTGFVWIVIRTDNDRNGEWHIQGVGTSEASAVSMCVNETYFIGPIPVDSPLPESLVQWVGSYFPHKKQNADATTRDTKLANDDKRASGPVHVPHPRSVVSTDRVGPKKERSR